MGTRADFYIRKEGKMKWLGSQGLDGYPEGIDDKVLQATTEAEFELSVNEYLRNRNDATFPKDGWPWPWNDSRTTDFSYIFEDGKVMASNFGYKLFDPLIISEDDGDDDDDVKLEGYFPDMKNIQNIAYDKRSGAIFLSVKNS
jgi:hypothetical protein